MGLFLQSHRDQKDSDNEQEGATGTEGVELGVMPGLCPVAGRATLGKPHWSSEGAGTRQGSRSPLVPTLVPDTNLMPW